MRPEPPPSRAELRYPPGAYYRRIALGTVLPGAGLLGTRWKVLGWLLVLASLAGGVWVLVRAWQGGLLRSALNVAVQPELLQWVGVGIMVGAVLWVGSIVLTAEQSWPRRRRSGRWARVLFAAAACTLIAAPSALAVRYLDVQSSVIDEVFVADGRRRRRTSPSPTPPRRTRGPTCRGSTPCSSAPTPARTAGAPAPTR